MISIRVIITIAITFLLSNDAIVASSTDLIPSISDKTPDNIPPSLAEALKPPSPSFEEGEVSPKSVNCKMSVTEAADSLNSIAFLRHLVGQKSTSDEIYYRGTGGDSSVANDGNVGMAGSSTTSICEYTGRLWFMKNLGGIRFREMIRIRDDGVSRGEEEPSSTAVECLTAFRRGNDGDWIDCSRVVCTFTKALTVEVDGEILLSRSIPMFGMAGAVKEKILQTFRSATEDFLGVGGV